MTKHTPGPWIAVPFDDPQWSVRSEHNEFQFICVTSQENDEANARLISAAPDLLAAAKLVQEFFECIELNSLQRFAATDCKRLIEAAVRKAEK